MSFAKASLLTILVRMFLMVVGLGIGIINARWLGPTGVGLYAVVLLVKASAFRFANLGFANSLTYHTARKLGSTRDILRIAALVGLVGSAVSVAAMLLVWGASWSPWRNVSPSLLGLGLGMVPALFAMNYLQAVLSGQLRITAMNLASAIHVLGDLVAVVVLVIWLKMGVPGAVLAMLLSDWLMALCLVWQCTRGGKVPASEGAPQTLAGGEGAADAVAQPTAPLLLRMWRYGYWSYWVGLANFLVEELPLMLLNALFPATPDVGIFTKARDLGRQFSLLAIPVSQVLFPFAAASHESAATERTNVLCRNTLLFTVLATAVLAAVARPLVVLLYGQAFAPAAVAFWVLAPGAAIWPAGHMLAVHVAAIGRPREVLMAELVALAVAASAGYVLIARYGALGAALSVGVVYTFQGLARLVVYLRASGARLSQVVVPRLGDRAHYAHLARSILGRTGKPGAGAD